MRQTFDYLRPTSIEEALRLGAEPGARFIAGGTDLMVRLKEGAEQAGTLVSQRSVPGLSGVQESADGALRIGAATPLAEIEGSALLAGRYPALARACSTVGSVQIRGVATLGGNLCNASPTADTLPALLVYGAEVEVEGAQGARRVALDEFVTGPGETVLGASELVVALRLAAPPPGRRSLYEKIGRTALDLAQVNLALALELEEGIVRRPLLAAGAVAPTPLRLRAVEEAIDGRLLDDALLDEAAGLARREVTPIDDLRASADYRRHLTAVLVRRGLEQLARGCAT